MRSKRQQLIYIFFLLAVLTATSACKKILDTEPENVLDRGNAYRDVYDADAAVIGIYGKLQTLAGQYVVLNELRADLLEVTDKAGKDLNELNIHKISKGNAYADPRPFYTVIWYCNDALKNFDKMLREKKFTQAEYNARYSDVGAVRSWVYLQLGIHFGSVPYVTEPFSDINDLKDSSRFPKLSFNELLSRLIEFTRALPVLSPYPSTTSLITSVDGVETDRFFIDKQVLLGDLYLWNNNYREAATNYKAVLERYSNSASTDERLNYFKLWVADVANNNDLAVGYIRYREQDQSMLINNNTQGWKSIFIRDRDALWKSEWLWAIPFNKNFAPVNPFVDLFAQNGGSYRLKPSLQAINNWNSQVQQNGAPYDARGIFTYSIENGSAVVNKYTYKYNPLLPLEKPGNWFLYRAALLHLHYAEAANRDNESKIAWAIVNSGISAAYPDTKMTGESAPYDMDARGGTGASYYGPWYRNTGIRNRAYLRLLSTDLQTDQTGMENAILSESALELAYEGNRWPDLLRVALRRNDPAFLADKISAKLAADGRPEAEETRQRLLNKENWYLPFTWE